MDIAAELAEIKANEAKRKTIAPSTDMHTIVSEALTKAIARVDREHRIAAEAPTIEIKVYEC